MQMVQKNNAQSLEGSCRICYVENMLLKILRKLLQNACEGARALGKLNARNLNFRADFSSLRI